MKASPNNLIYNILYAIKLYLFRYFYTCEIICEHCLLVFQSSVHPDYLFNQALRKYIIRGSGLFLKYRCIIYSTGALE